MGETEPVARLVAFARALRDAGLPVGLTQTTDLCAAAALVSPADLYWAGRATMAPDAEQVRVYDRVFAECFGRPVPGLPRPVPEPEPAGVRESRAPGAAVDEPQQVTTGSDRASPIEVLGRERFGALDDEERAHLARARTAPPVRRSHRSRPAPRGELDLARTLRAALRRGGEPVELARRRRGVRPRRTVMLVDVSRSMHEEARRWLLAGHVAVRAGRHVEVFAFGTRLTRLTHELRSPSAALALDRAGDRLHDRNAGTRIGECLRTFIDEHGRRGMARRALLVICSDGLETGDPALLAQQMRRLRRLAWRIVWVNPLAADPGFEPLQQGMQAVLGHVDLLSSGDFGSASWPGGAGLPASPPGRSRTIHE